jgi:regulator of cell morphogenesis and NO signaling
MSTPTSTAEADLDWRSRPLAEVIEFILTRFHEPLRRDLPDLIERARQVESATSGRQLAGLASHLSQVRLAVESHLAKEEKILFPLILAGRGATALMPIRVMMTEHEDHKQNLRRTRELTHDFSLPADAPAAWRDLFRDLDRLEADLAEHIALENEVLFTRALEDR